MSEGIQKVVGLTIFAALIVLGIVASDTDGQTTTRNAAIPMLNMDGEEEPPPPSDKALAKLEDKVNEMGEMILELAAQMEELNQVAGNGQVDPEQVQQQIAQAVEGLTRQINAVSHAAILRSAGCHYDRGNGPVHWACEPFIDEFDMYHGPDFRGEDFSGADLSGAILVHAFFDGANLRGADLRGAYLGNARFDGADLTGADLTGANFGIGWNADTVDDVLNRAILDGVIGLP